MAEVPIRQRLDEYAADLLGQALVIIDNLTDREPCRWDHNHSCQEHGWFYLAQGEKCPMQEAKDFYAAHKPPDDDDESAVSPVESGVDTP